MIARSETPIVLAQGGLPQVKIVLPAGASAPEEYAAEELRRHLYEIIGAGPRVRNSARSRGRTDIAAVYVNDREAAEAAGIGVAGLELGAEAFHLETRGGSLYLLAGGPRGALYGVYELLEMLGCRWFTPEVRRLPRRRGLVLPPVRKSAAPAFEFRDMWNWDCSDPVWWVRNRMNGCNTPVPDYLGGNVNYGLFVHTFDRLAPPDELFAEHPDYFSEINGVRRRDASQLCLTNPDVLRIVTERVLEHMRKDPKSTIFSVSQNDCEGYCECPRCRAVAEEEGAQSGPILRFVNAVAAETSKVLPDKLIDTLAYWYSLDAPRHAVPHPNVRVRLCSIRCCQGHGYGTCDHPESLRFLRALQGWARITERMYIWHYCTDFAHYPLPMPDFDEIHANINLYRKFGVYGVFMQGMGEEGGGGESMALRGYVISKLLWDPDRPVWPLIDEFLAAYYGAAAPKVRMYLDVFHSRVRKDRNLHPSLFDQPTTPLFDEETVARADAALAEGEPLVRGAKRRRVRLLRDGLSYARLYRKSGAFRREGDVYRGEATEEDLRRFDSMIRDWKRAGMQRIREGAPFAFTEGLLRNRLTAHAVKWLGDGEQAIAVVPDLGGRLLEWHAGGRQWLAPPDPDNGWMPYPASEGYVEFAIHGLGNYKGWGERYRCLERDGAVTLTAKVADGLWLSRRVSLRQGALHIASRLQNRGQAPAHCGWGAALHLVVPTPAAMTFTAPRGPMTLAWEEIADGLESARVLTGEQLPLGEWRAEMSGFILIHRFDGPIARAIIGKVEAARTLALDLRTEEMMLEPGQAVEVRQEARICPS